MDKKLKELMDLIKADDLGQLPDNTGANTLLKPVAAKVIEELIEANVLRRFFPRITIPKEARNLTVPAIVYGDTNNVRVIDYGEDATSGNETTYATKSIVLIPRLLVTYVDIIEDDLETSIPNLARFIRKALTTKLAEAEEKAMFTGVYNSSSGGYANIFNGIYTVAKGSSCATSPVTYGASDDLIEKIADAKKSLGVYGRSARDLVLFCSYTFGNKLRKNEKIYNVNFMPGSDVLKTGTLPPILGVKVIETSILDDVENGEVAILVRKDAFLVGERKAVWVKTDEIVEKFTSRIIMAEQIDFKPQLINTADKFEGIVLIHKAS